MMVIIVAIIVLAILSVAFAIIVNCNFRIAYCLYSIPKIHYIVKWICFRNIDYLKTSSFIMPIPIQSAIDDLGWMHGSDLRRNGGPSRLIVNRNPGLKEYKELVKISELSGCRLIGLFIMSELDINNICGEKQYNRPICNSDITEYGLSWENKVCTDEAAMKLMEFIKDNSSCIEFGMHGVRHEHYDESGYTNAEWADKKNGVSWGSDNTRIHCEVFKRLIRQYYTEEECDFPHIFVPPSHCFDKNDKDSISLMNQYGIKYMCSSCTNQPTMKELCWSGGFDTGILMLDRTEICVPEKIGYAPKKISAVNSMLGTHFPNYWGAVKKWHHFFKNVNRQVGCVVGKNSEYTYSQWLYTRNTSIFRGNNRIELNNRYMPSWAYDNHYLYGIVLKIHLHKKQHVSKIVSKELALIDYYEDEFDNAYLTLGDTLKDNSALDKRIYEFEYKLDKSTPECTHFIREKQTYNILTLRDYGNSVHCKIRIYGKHCIKIFIDAETADVSVENNDITIENLRIHNKILSFNVDCKEMLGKDMIFTIKRKR